MRLDALVINLNRFGDLLLSQPLLHDLHKAGRSTTLLCLEKYADTEGLLQFASPLLTVPDHLVSPEQADATRHELQAWAENLRATVQADHIINLTPSMPARLLATALAPAPEAVLGFGLDHKGRPRVDGLVLAKLTSGQWSEGITTSACREARIWQTATDSRGFITTTCLSDHKADDRTLWLCQQRVYWRRILDDLTSGATEPTPLTNVPLSMACPNYSSQFAARVGKALSHCAHLLQTLLQECAPLPESFDPTGHPLCMTILQHMQSCPELASMAFFWHQLCQHYQGRGPRFLQAVRLLHAHILRWAKSFD